ncbi:Hypothetical predicted protein [Octopus vulgaris]|uniref:Uncharacterized protein n=1 Tax=Octopus vulgaris TaxID=6645 RepID=A0AA36ALC8_OCTVU|nr:Hypothetical predicted protein [Octopus vulgaris]
MPQERKSNLGKNTRHAFAMRSLRASETAEQADRRCASAADSTSMARASVTPEKDNRRCARDAVSMSMARASETPEQADRRRARDAASTSNSRALETADQRATRLETDSHQKIRRHVFPRVSLCYWSNKAFHYSPQEDYASHPHIIIGRMSTVCVHCNATR